MAIIKSWREAKPGEMLFGGKGVLIPYAHKQHQRVELTPPAEIKESTNPKAESSDPPTRQTLSAEQVAQHKANSQKLIQALVENLNRNVVKNNGDENV